MLDITFVFYITKNNIQFIYNIPQILSGKKGEKCSTFCILKILYENIFVCKKVKPFALDFQHF